jgi:hypothetical protein
LVKRHFKNYLRYQLIEADEEENQQQYRYTGLWPCDHAEIPATLPLDKRQGQTSY